MMDEDFLIYGTTSDVCYFLAACIDAEHTCWVDIHNFALAIPLVASFCVFRFATEEGGGELVGDEFDGIARLPVGCTVEQVAKSDGAFRQHIERYPIPTLAQLQRLYVAVVVLQLYRCCAAAH